MPCLRGPMSAAFLAAMLAACSGPARLGQIDRFAQAGAAFADTVPAMTDESLDLSVRKDSQVLLSTRNAISPDERLSNIEKSNQAFQERIEIFRDFENHAQVLKSYFDAMRSL